MNSAPTKNNASEKAAEPLSARKLLPELIIVAAVFYGLWSMMIVPLRSGLSQARAAHAEAIEHTRIAGDPQLSRPRLDMVMGSIDSMMEDIEQRSEIARDQTALQARLMELGDEAGIRIDRVNPARTRPLGQGDRDDTIVSFELDCSGRYDDITGFVAAIEERVGLTAVERFSIRPDTSGSGSAVKVRLRTAHFAFDLSPSNPLADAAGLEGAQQ